jgi:hypothetical protein
MARSLPLAELVDIAMPALIEQYGHKLTTHQRQALEAIAHCRSGAFGVTAMRCPQCDSLRYRMRSCGHRSCPQCQHHTASQWLERQQAKLLPVNYFMATFTLPPTLRPVAFRHPQRVYRAMFHAVAATLKAFGFNHRDLHAELGFCAVLHTHSRRLDYHPHIHVVIPGGGIDHTEKRSPLWRVIKGNYLFNGFALAKVFRAKVLDALVRDGIELPASLPRQWVVHCKHVGRGLSALQYLSRYLYRGVIAQRDIVHYNESRHTVTFRYRDAKSKCFHYRTLSIADFLWHIAMHVLPKGLQRVRNYGFLHGNAQRLLDLVQLVLRVVLPKPHERKQSLFVCSVCAAPMHPSVFLPAPHPSG